MIKRKNKVIGVLMLMAVLLFVPMSGIIGEILEDANITLVAKAKVIEGDFEFEVFENEKRATLTKYNGTASVVTELLPYPAKSIQQLQADSDITEPTEISVPAETATTRV